MMESQKHKVLLVEDDLRLRTALRDKLFGFAEIYEAEDGEQAITAVLEKTPHLVILDLLLPKLDGFQVLERIRSYPDPVVSKTRVVVLSNLWSQKDILQVEGLKVDAYYVKAQASVDEVVANIREMLAKMA